MILDPATSARNVIEATADDVTPFTLKKVVGADNVPILLVVDDDDNILFRLVPNNNGQLTEILSRSGLASTSFDQSEATDGTWSEATFSAIAASKGVRFDSYRDDNNPTDSFTTFTIEAQPDQTDPLLILKDENGATVFSVDPVTGATQDLPAATPHTVQVGDDLESGIPGSARYMRVEDNSVTVWGLIDADNPFPSWIFTADGSFLLGTGQYDLANPDIPTDALGIIGFQPDGNGMALYGGGSKLSLQPTFVSLDVDALLALVTATDLYRRGADAAPQVELPYQYEGGTTAPPGLTKIAFDDADPTLAAAVYLDFTDQDVVDTTDLLTTFPLATLNIVDSTGHSATFAVTGRTAHVGYQEFAVTLLDSVGALDQPGLVQVRFTGRRGYEARNTEPDDATLLEGGYTTWLDATAGAPLLMVKAKDSAGDVFTASIPLTAV